MKISNYDLDQFFEQAVKNFSDKRKPNLMSERQFRAMCYAEAVTDYLYAHGLLTEQVSFPEERLVESVFED